MLGLVLYTIFILYISILSAYADDTAFLATSSLRREGTHIVQDMLNEFEAWSSRRNIGDSSAKRWHATLPLNRLNTYGLTLDGTLTKRLKHTVKILGLTLDWDFT